MSKLSLREYRENYSAGQLLEADAPADPVELFQQWLKAAQECEYIIEPTAMGLATIGADGQPSNRMVLLKELDSGLVFYSNYNSHKAKQLSANAQAALLFYWPPLERQVRVEGTVEPIDSATSEDYFHSRPRASQLGAAASPQSKVVEPGEVEKRFKALEAEHADQDVPRPDDWGGYRVVPTLFEFWQGRRSRLHDRLQYQLDSGEWHMQRLAP